MNPENWLNSLLTRISTVGKKSVGNTACRQLLWVVGPGIGNAYMATSTPPDVGHEKDYSHMADSYTSIPKI